MELKKITEKVSYFHGSVNIGYLRLSSEEGMLIDAGLDDQAMKKVIKQLKEQSLPISHLFITHAHADHYGGAAYLQEKQDVYTFAPEFEAAILQNPMIEPLYLFHGVHPIAEWRNKFLEGKPVRIDSVLQKEGVVRIGNTVFQTIALPGHSYNQFGVIFDDILFATDGYFGIEALEKHGIPFIVDAAQTIETLEKLTKLPCKGAVPGHGSYEEAYVQTVEKNLDVHKEIEHFIHEQVKANPDGIALEKLVTIACLSKGIQIKNAPSFMLFRTAVTAYLTKLMKQNQVCFVVEQNQLLVVSSSK
ncbi:MBL fold metallo-hydrolase [Sutcliffiella halmapala]|uniref:MBL fold metallo-hydrolase n=1 Tax=Sutcliffiella halmapala TaxID=79882 RepID=UPI000995B2C3|nr:MBL fold metallo-hydrolase [Sutcliffiella halmapala]